MTIAAVGMAVTVHLLDKLANIYIVPSGFIYRLAYMGIIITIGGITYILFSIILKVGEVRNGFSTIMHMINRLFSRKKGVISN